MERRIPPTLLPYIENQPSDALTVLTSTLSNDSSWLIIRYIAHALRNHSVSSTSSHVKGTATGVLLVSYLKDLAFWHNECKRTTGIDLEATTREGRFTFLSDGTTLPNQASRPISGSINNPKQQDILLSQLGNIKPILDKLQGVSHQNSSVLVVIDSLDLLLGLSTEDNLVTEVLACITRLRRHPAVHSVILSMSVSLAYPFEAVKTAPLQSVLGDVQAQVPTSLEMAQQAFLTASLHTATLLVSLRPLDTGAAGDVSGVVRITRGSAYGDLEVGTGQGYDEGEWLYHVAGDGRVKMWERTAGVG